eukprot:CAMPEP_0174261604 /NCGR_PEP_ID=MMETSP0439-20130205/11572_1 /TAXON_ID=0 /ORGANISM="Stereomyxa ramosa, Strain Chinc5" /LENGTH=266 /DNA_ID=CAMNT_0015346105 /DNA_START=1 /DNA_END=801 /DNA_ORIENTATION=+
MENTEDQYPAYPRLSKKVVLITGASAGIGKDTAYLFGKSGAHLVLGARRVERLEALKDELSSAFGVTVHVAHLDVSDAKSVQEFVDKIPDNLKNIDILVNNAGLALGKHMAYDTPEKYINTMMDVNVKGVLYMNNSIIPGMIQRNSGHVINVSSVSGKEAYIGGSVYCATKHAVQAITNSLRKEVAGTKIRVTSICPGLVETEFSMVRFEGDKDKADSTYTGMDPLLGMDIADNIVYTASRPGHVQIADMLIFPSNQASTEIVIRQ